MAICKLCNQDKPLVRAHIFPNWTYKPLKQDGHFIQLTGLLKSRKLQSGHWDDNILCKECDGDVIGKYDTYAAQFFSQDFMPLLSTFKEATSREAKTYHVKNFDYIKLYIFIISMFWRASITNQRLFAKVNLGRYESLAKDIIVSGIPKYEDLFEIVIFAAKPPVSGQEFEKSIVLPFPTKFGEVNCYRFVVAGFDFVLKVDQRKSNLHVGGIKIHPEGFNIILIPFESSTIGKVTAFIRKKFRENRK